MKCLYLFLIMSILQACSNHIGSTSATSAAVLSGNGSSGIGNMVSMVGNIQAHMATSDSVKVDNHIVLDGKTGEQLIQIDEVPQNADVRSSRHLVPAQLGDLKGFEYLPDEGSSNETNYWLVCTGKQTCYKFSPLSTTNSKVSAVIGALTRTR